MAPNGATEFTLWAPAARSVDLLLGAQAITLARDGGGWYRHTDATVASGSAYQYRIDGAYVVPDPASHYQPRDCDGASEIVDHKAYTWRDRQWRGRPWAEAVLYELHVGAFSASGDYAGIIEHLPHLERLGVTAIELMPLADFYGRRNWGYDGVLPFAPDSTYGRPEDFKALVDAAHAMGIMVLLDVVYNHFGPEGNYLSLYAPQFFTSRHKTPWGDAIDFSIPEVRSFFVQNACHWLSEYHLDGLRFDAVHEIIDDSPKHILFDLRDAVTDCTRGREVHLILENDANQAGFLGHGRYRAQWNDDMHHACHVLATSEQDGYYVSYADRPAQRLARCLTEGYGYQGEIATFNNKPRGEPSAHLPLSAFVNFLQNHDQIGNRALGERLICLAEEARLKFVLDILLLAPSPPLLFMGEEWGCRQPFLFFCDFPGELGELIRNGRRGEFAHFAAFSDPQARAAIPDPLAESTYEMCRLRWQNLESTNGRLWFERYQHLLALRRREIAPRRLGAGRYRMLSDCAFDATWDGGLRLSANCGSMPITLNDTSGRVIHGAQGGEIDPWSLAWRVMP